MTAIPDFKPINAHGRMSAESVRAGNRLERRGLKKATELYQVMVEQEDGSVIPAGPKMIKPACEKYLVAINAQISMGKERQWSNPHLVRA